MVELNIVRQDLGAVLADVGSRHTVAGCALAVWQDGHSAFGSIGHADTLKTVPVASDTVFSLFSIAKMFTATLVMMAVEEGRLALDAPVGSLLGPFYGTVTIRHLLTHSSGIPGDVLIDTGANADCIDRYIEIVASMAPYHAPGELVSYCNAGFVVLGGLLERLYDEPFDALLARKLLKPLGILSGRCETNVAVTHLPAPGGKLVPTDATYPAALAPAGATLKMTVQELLMFARLHLGDICGEMLSPRLRRNMMSLAAALPSGLCVRGFGLGWMLDTLEGHAAVGHDGASMTFLRLLPQENAAIVLLTNGGEAAVFRDAVFRALIGQDPVQPTPATAGRVSRAYDGRYANRDLVMEIDNGRLRVVALPGVTSAKDTGWRAMIPLGDDVFALGCPHGDRVAFTFSDSGAQWLHWGVRALAPAPRHAAA